MNISILQLNREIRQNWFRLDKTRIKRWGLLNLSEQITILNRPVPNVNKRGKKLHLETQLSQDNILQTQL